MGGFCLHPALTKPKRLYLHLKQYAPPLCSWPPQGPCLGQSINRLVPNSICMHESCACIDRDIRMGTLRLV